MSQKGIQTRKNILEKSLQLFSVKGYFNTSINDIMEATNLTKGGLYGHFRSKEDIWYAVYDDIKETWKNLVFEQVREIEDPLERIEKAIDNDLRKYLGGEICDGGCFFLNMLVELSGQSSSMTKHILRGFVGFSRLIEAWLEEAREKEMLKEGVNLREAANFIVITLNGAAALYAAGRDPQIWEQTIAQLRFYINQMKK